MRLPFVHVTRFRLTLVGNSSNLAPHPQIVIYAAGWETARFFAEFVPERTTDTTNTNTNTNSLYFQPRYYFTNRIFTKRNIYTVQNESEIKNS